MTNIYTGSNTTSAVGMDYNTNPSRAANLYRTLATSPNPSSFRAEKNENFDFANAIYGQGPYNLLRPNNTTETTAARLDFIA